MTREQSTVVSAKVPKKLKQEFEKLGMNMSEAIRSGLEEVLREKKIEQLEELLRGVNLGKLSDDQIVRDIRKGREQKNLHQE